MFIFLFDQISTVQDRDIVKKIGGEIVDSPSISDRQIFRWLKGAFKVIRLTDKNDTIICWYDFQAILCFWICKLLFLKRRIIALNILLKDKDTLKNKIVLQLYRRAVLAKNFKASVTSKAYGEWLNKKLGVKERWTLIHDIYHDSYECTNYAYASIKKSVFCGGRNGRDWNFMIEIAKSLPHLEFNLIMPKNLFLKYENTFTSNIHALYDVSYDEFMKTLCASSLVCLPLDTEAPAGLIVMFQAVANDKMVITTDTMTTKEYVGTDRGLLLPNDMQQWSNAIEYYLKEDEERKWKAGNMKCFLKNECSEQAFVNSVKKMILC